MVCIYYFKRFASSALGRLYLKQVHCFGKPRVGHVGRGIKLCNEVQDTAPEFHGFGINFTTCKLARLASPQGVGVGCWGGGGGGGADFFGGCSRQAHSPPAECLDVGVANPKSNLRGGQSCRLSGGWVTAAETGSPCQNLCPLRPGPRRIYSYIYIYIYVCICNIYASLVANKLRSPSVLFQESLVGDESFDAD